MKKTFAFTLLALAAGVTAYAQLPVAPSPHEPGKGAAPGAAKKEEPKETPRMARLKALDFDRRPSSILKAWAPQPAPKKDESAKEPGAPKNEAKEPDPKAAEKAAELDKEIAAFQKNVTLGKWAEVKSYLASLPADEGAAGYKQLLTSLQGRPGMGRPGGPGGVDPMEMQMMQGPGQQFVERNVFSADDVLGLAAAAPVGKEPVKPKQEKETLAALGAIFREAVTGGTLPEVAVSRLKAETAKPAGQAVLTKRQAAKLLAGAGLAEFAGDFLPLPEQAQKDKDLEALNLLSRHFLALHAKESKSGNLERAWAAVQAVLGGPDGVAEEKDEALIRAVELAPRLKDALGQEWLGASFTKNPERGQEILASVGTLVSRGLTTRPHAIDERLNALKLSQTAVSALMKAAPARAKEWKPALTVLALGWQKEAEFSQRFDQSSGGSRLRRDMYGNIFFASSDEDDQMSRMQMMQQPNMPRPIQIADVIKAAPDAAWLAAIDESLRPKLSEAVARLHLKVNEEAKAFPLIEQLAGAQPAEAKGLVKEFLRVWTRNHDPNASRNENRYSWFFFAFEQRAESIPLTRSKQERNLKELSDWVARIKKLPGAAGELDDEAVVRAFTACHSSAEVYRTEAIEAVFGPLGGLKPKTLAGLADQMRTNLAGLWKEPANQEKNKTKRKKKDIEAEVLRGYQVAQAVLADGLKKFPDRWALLAAQAGLMHDEINYRQELSKASDFSAKRTAAFKTYRRAAEEYAKAARALPEDEHTTSVYEQWFAAGLGAVDLGMISEEKQPDWAQPPLIRAALLALPGDLAEKHMGKFANNLFIKMSGAKPHVKFNYLKAGFQIVGDHKQAAEAKKVFDYYKDLVTEIKLEAVLDGSSEVGHGRPFGLFVNLKHTRDIERESGGFGRYLQNQNSMAYSYNYGRPTADYRDRFETAARTALKEQFEVVSVTFQDEKVTSRATPGEFGWRYTPYAYILLKPRGPQVDKIPPLRLDLDFLETSGYVVMPVETPAVPISARTAGGDPRPVDKLSVTQTLDERQADKGALLLEVKAVGVGLVPEWAELAGNYVPDGFEVTKTETNGLGVKKFDEDNDGNAVVSEQVWTLTLKGREDRTELPKAFRFASVKVPTKEVVYQRYADADLTPVSEEVSLEQSYGKKKSNWLWYALAGVAAVFVLVATVVLLAVRGGKRGPVEAGLPDRLDPFVAAALLREIRERPELTVSHRAALDQDLAEIEQYHFAAGANGHPAPDLRKIVERWAATAPRATSGNRQLLIG
ncbi:Uncharacterized protein OS=Isosphaera pallida (strain ATCC 43644 / DSM 9630 / IS1B) GN=Isop_3573 PE=4 SV=1 [Gemmata massiliana]|uniref:Uncharacterized protein n=1 Tax=Gemmata massiliana TaxID=1210884 RepID=A0A6P2D514_9BACT|nr:hypothetical protein [Gemmata massiliana]VTR95174.1 Uncharacterized protein OS=Isosphaera pallida (strain ATCC 43644 / DSM 9630 / IS1B) GN=Isop_3573 PE=4 SV=1 [Gemmata massiliana]